MTVRQSIADMLITDWAEIYELADVYVKASQGRVDVDSRVTCIVSQQAIGAFPQAPISHRTASLVLEIVSPVDDIDAAADELEDIVPAILDYLDSRFQHGTAEAFLYDGESQFAYRIPVSVIVTKE